MKKARVLRFALAAGVGVAALALLPGIATATAPQTSTAAATTCAVKADLPSRVTIDREDVQVNVHLSGCAGGLDWAAASVYGHDGTIGLLYWDSDANRDQYLDVWSLTTPGTYRTLAGDGESLGDNSPVTWTYDSTVIKYRSTAYVHTSRSGTRVRIGASVYQYRPYVGYVRSPKRTVSLEMRRSASAPWQTIRHLTTDANGWISYSRTDAHKAYYRIAPWNSTTAFDTRSASSPRV